MITFHHNENLTKEETLSRFQEIQNKIVDCKNLEYDDDNNGIGQCRYFNMPVHCLKNNLDDGYNKFCNKCYAINANNNYYKKINDFVIITCYYNPQKSKNRYNNFRKFADHMKDLGIDLYTIEGYYYKDEPHLTTNDCNNLITLEFYDILWQKERLLNILIEKLPPHIDSFGWFDADIIFSCDNLKEKCIELLSYYPVIQPWNKANFLDADNKLLENFYSMSSDNFFRRSKIVDQYRNHPGFAWCMRKETWRQINGLYDVMICGNGDTFMAMGFFGHLNYPFLKQEKINEPASQHFVKWWNICSKVVNSQVGYLNVTIDHLYHGTRKNRRYWERVKCLFENGFDPNLHLEFADNKTFKYSNKAPTIVKNYIKDLLLGRKDDE